jgi:glutathione S-transferase
MKLYFSPLACSMAARIALYEAGATADFEQVDAKTKRTSRGQDFRRVHGLGLVPVLELADGFVISENAAVLQHIARAFPDARLAPTEPHGIARLQQWLCFIGTELHKALFIPLLDRQAAPGAKDHALGKAHSRLSYLAEQLGEREYLLHHFSVADAYLFTILNWTAVTPVASGRASRARSRKSSRSTESSSSRRFPRAPMPSPGLGRIRDVRPISRAAAACRTPSRAVPPVRTVETSRRNLLFSSDRCGSGWQYWHRRSASLQRARSRPRRPLSAGTGCRARRLVRA